MCAVGFASQGRCGLKKESSEYGLEQEWPWWRRFCRVA